MKIVLKGRCVLPFNVECQCKQDCCWVEMNLATFSYWGYYQILNIGVSFSLFVAITSDHCYYLLLVVIIRRASYGLMVKYDYASIMKLGTIFPCIGK